MPTTDSPEGPSGYFARQSPASCRPWCRCATQPIILRVEEEAIKRLVPVAFFAVKNASSVQLKLKPPASGGCSHESGTVRPDLIEFHQSDAARRHAHSSGRLRGRQKVGSDELLPLWVVILRIDGRTFSLALTSVAPALEGTVP